MSGNERRRQDKIERQRKKKKKKDAEKREATAHAAQKTTERLKSAFGTTAMCWPIRYRALFFEELPALDAQSLSFTGVDLHMKWYETQEARTADVDGEVVTALRIESCEPVQPEGGFNRDELWLACKGTLSEQIADGSLYGSWYRKQWQADDTIPEGEEYRDIPVEFTLRCRRFRGSQTKSKNRFMRSIETIPFVPDAWNVYHIDVPDHIRMDGNALDIDRLNEILFMLRIWTPILTSQKFSVSSSEQTLRSELLALEQREKEASAVLAERSAETSAFLLEMSAAYHALESARVILSEFEEAHRQREAEFKAIEGEAGNGEEFESRLRKARKLMNVARDAKLAELTRFQEVERSSQQRQAEAERLFTNVISEEFKAADAFTRPFLQRQRVLAWLSRL